VNETPEKAGERPCRPLQRPTRGNRVGKRGSIPTFSAERYTAFGDSRRLERFAHSECSRSADLTSKAGETLRSPNGGVPAVRGEAAVTRDRRDRERPAVAEGCGAVSMRWAVGADCCGAMGCRESDGLVRVEDGGDRRVLCLWHARRWVR